LETVLKTHDVQKLSIQDFGWRGEKLMFTVKGISKNKTLIEVPGNKIFLLGSTPEVGWLWLKQKLGVFTT
jgi:hypothetical protein